MLTSPDPRIDELETQLPALDLASELAYRYLYRKNSPHCRRDPAWRQRIAELETQLILGSWPPQSAWSLGTWSLPPQAVTDDT
jgi:hypothetical protein